MAWKKIFGFGCLGLLALFVIGSTAAWYFSPGFPITVDDPGKGGQRVTINDRPANYFPGVGNGPRPAILMLGGSEGGLQERGNKMARQLQAAGFSVLYPGYYRTSEATKSFNLVPLETFDEALAWLKSRKDIDSARIAIIGTSKGGEAALLVASQHPEITAVVAAVPSNTVWQGFDMGSMDMSKFSSSWSRGGKAVTYLPYTMPEFSAWFDGNGIEKMYRLSLTKLPEHADAVIKVEDIAGPILLICGEKDTLWPSCPMSQALEQRAKEFEGPAVSILTYSEAGHAAFGVPLAEGDKNFAKLSSFGGSPGGNNDARKDSWPRVMAFLKEHLTQ